MAAEDNLGPQFAKDKRVGAKLGGEFVPILHHSMYGDRRTSQGSTPRDYRTGQADNAAAKRGLSRSVDFLHRGPDYVNPN